MLRRKLKDFVVIAGILLTASISPAMAETGKAPDPMAVKRGSDLYSRHCISCHQKDGVGEMIPWGIRNPNYLAAMPLNESSHAWHHGDKQLIQMIQRGNQRMPPFSGVLTVSEIGDIVAYMKSLWSERIVACQGPKHMSCM